MKKIALLIVCIVSGLAIGQVKEVHLLTEMNKTHQLDDGSVVEMWGFGLIKAMLPGPLLEFDLGDTVHIHLHNESPEDHTIHLHGLDVDQANDGVPSTSSPVSPFDSTVYTFVANHAGSYLYHCHVMTPLHLMMGMYGVIVVRNLPDTNRIFQGGPTFNKEHVFLASDMDRSVNLNPTDPGPFHLFVMDYFMINGLSGIPLQTDPDHQVTANPGDSVLLRLSSMAYSKVRYIFPEELNAVAYMSDGRALPVPYPCDTLELQTGERYEVLLTPEVTISSTILVEYFASRNDELQHTNHITVNGDIGIEEQAGETRFEVYPNPSEQLLYFVTDQPGSSLQVVTLSGKVIFETEITDQMTVLDFGAYPSGIYLLRYQGQVTKLVKP